MEDELQAFREVILIEPGLALLNRGMNHSIRPHPSPLPQEEGTRVFIPFSLGRRAGDEGNSSLNSAIPSKVYV